MRRLALSVALTVLTLGTLGIVAKEPLKVQLSRVLAALGLERKPLRNPSATPPAKPKPVRAPRKIAPLQRVRSSGGAVIYIPADCLRGETRFDVLFHFHGAADVVAEEFKEAELYAVLAVLNVGVGGATYARGFAGKGMLESLLAQVDAEVRAKCGTVPARGRIALSGFSAGYGAALTLLRSDAKSVDAVLLADGIHAGFDDVRRRHIENNQLKSFIEFGKAAVRGEKLFAITHSAIQTPNYPSTTESTDFLLKKLGLTRTIDIGAKTSYVHASGFRLEGEPGMDAKAHMRHLHRMGKTLWPLLRERWESSR